MGLYTGDFLEDVFSIEHILSVMLGGEQGITKAQEPWLEKAILIAFEMVGITPDNPESWKKEPEPNPEKQTTPTINQHRSN